MLVNNDFSMFLYFRCTDKFSNPELRATMNGTLCLGVLMDLEEPSSTECLSMIVFVHANK